MITKKDKILVIDTETANTLMREDGDAIAREVEEYARRMA